MKRAKKLAFIAFAVGLICAANSSALAGSVVNNRAPQKAGWRTVSTYAAGDRHMHHREGLEYRRDRPASHTVAALRN
jgi:hypothetical protein